MILRFPSPKKRLLLVVVNDHDSEVWLRRGWSWSWKPLGSFDLKTTRENDAVVGLELKIKKEVI